MSTYIHVLTETERACGVTLEDVARELPRGLFIDNDSAFVVAANVGPALGASIARCAFAGRPVRFSGLNGLGQPVYRVQ